ncbi:hypothetical protein Pcinc_026015 [Petrolisthes cinctipes]|uniref:Uncharacterized protein n=1 Tax=Petrolisthes cinctipes TaxID=88211 RepID=A0AAE1F841_PETCI|nr:hypothetical protein Pcinc_026015 [Petrolisthes cinctipes]
MKEAQKKKKTPITKSCGWFVKRQRRETVSELGHRELVSSDKCSSSSSPVIKVASLIKGSGHVDGQTGREGVVVGSGGVEGMGGGSSGEWESGWNGRGSSGEWGGVDGMGGVVVVSGKVDGMGGGSSGEWESGRNGRGSSGERLGAGEREG